MSILSKAKAIQGKRKKRYGDLDKKRNSKIRRKPTEKNLEVWSRNPGRSDMIGVDGEGTPTLKRDQVQGTAPKKRKAAPKKAAPQKRLKRTKVGPGVGAKAKMRKAQEEAAKRVKRREQQELEAAKAELKAIREKEKKEGKDPSFSKIGGLAPQELKKSSLQNKIAGIQGKRRKEKVDALPYRMAERNEVDGKGYNGQYVVFDRATGKRMGVVYRRDYGQVGSPTFDEKRNPWGFFLMYGKELVYDTGRYAGFKTKEKAVEGLKKQPGLKTIYENWKSVEKTLLERSANYDASKNIAQYAGIYNSMTQKGMKRGWSFGVRANEQDMALLGYLLKKDYLVPLPNGWQLGIPDYETGSFLKGPKFDDMPPPEMQQDKAEKWYLLDPIGPATKQLKDAFMEAATATNFNFSNPNEYQEKKLYALMAITYNEAERRDRLSQELEKSENEQISRIKRYFNTFVSRVNSRIDEKSIDRAFTFQTMRDPLEVGGRYRKRHAMAISEQQVNALTKYVRREVTEAENQFLSDSELAATYVKGDDNLLNELSGLFSRQSGLASSAVVGPARFPAERMIKRQGYAAKAEDKFFSDCKKYGSRLMQYLDGSKFQDAQRAELQRASAEQAGFTNVAKNTSVGTWEFDFGTMRLNLTPPAARLSAEDAQNLRRAPYAMKWSPRFKQYTRRITWGTVSTNALRRALKADYGFELPDPNAPKQVTKQDVPGSIVDNLSTADRSKVSMKIDELARLASEAKAKGEAAPNYNLCEITVPGTNIYCEGNKGIPRAEMPQFKGKAVPGSVASNLPENKDGEVDTEPMFRMMLKEKGIAVTPKEVYSDTLKATQSELVGAKVAGMTKALEANPNNPGITAPIFVSNDGYVIDGHHRWAAITSYAIAQGKPTKMKVEVIDLPIGEAIRTANDFANEIGIAQKAAKTEAATKERKSEQGSGAPKKLKTEASQDLDMRIGATLDIDYIELKSQLVDALGKMKKTTGSARKQFDQLVETVMFRIFKKASDSNATAEELAAMYVAQFEIYPMLSKPQRRNVDFGFHEGPFFFDMASGKIEVFSKFEATSYYANLEAALSATPIPKIKKMRIYDYRIVARNKFDDILPTITDYKSWIEKNSKFLKKYAGNDELRPTMMGVNVMDTGFTVTDANSLVHIAADVKSAPGENSSMLLQPQVDKEVGDPIEGKYPNWRAVVPTRDTKSVYLKSFAIEQLYKLAYLYEVMKIANREVAPVVMRLPDESTPVIIFQAKKTIATLEACYSLDQVYYGRETLSFLYSASNRAAIFVPNYNLNTIDSERNTYVLLMPMIVDTNIKFEDGGMVKGPSHAQGGVDMTVQSTGQMVELEGGEGVVNKRSMSSNKMVTFNGKRMKPCQVVSQINQMDGNGVPIEC